MLRDQRHDAVPISEANYNRNHQQRQKSEQNGPCPTLMYFLICDVREKTRRPRPKLIRIGFKQGPCGWPDLIGLRGSHGGDTLREG